LTVTLGDVTIADQQVPADSYGRLGIDVTRGRLSIRDWRALRRDSGGDPREFVALNPDLALSNASRRAVSEPRLLHEVKPQYTRDAMEAKIEGQVELDAIVERDGSVTGSESSSPWTRGSISTPYTLLVNGASRLRR